MINDNAIVNEHSPIHFPVKSEVVASKMLANANTLAAEIEWCECVIATRFKLHFQQECGYSSVYDIPTPPIDEFDVNSTSSYANFIVKHQLGFKERLLLILALLPYVKPSVLDAFLMINEQINRPFTEFGGTYVDDVYVATGETWAFLLSSASLVERVALQDYLAFRAETAFVQGGDLYAGDVSVVDLLDSTIPEKRRDGFFLPLMLAKEYVPFFTTGAKYKAAVPADFPAQLVTTNKAWDSLGLSSKVLAQLDEIKGWSHFHDTLMQDWGLGEKVRPGLRVLFYGPPGTGKTVTVGVLSKALGKDAYRVDLSVMLSKFIGETEKNLERVFRLAEQQSWLLFFDEADALFGKRIETRSSNDQFANQTVSYLLQRIERFDGVVVLASNYKDNLDGAFLRRFESVIHFPKPDAAQRLHIWKTGFSEKTQLDDDVDLHDIAMKYDITGALIMNVIRFASLKALMAGRHVILKKDLHEGIQREQSQNTAPRW